MNPTTTNAASDQPHESSREAANRYLELGFVPIPAAYRSKVAIPKGWPDLTCEGYDLDLHFPENQERNVGLLLGPPSGGLIDCDLDCKEARNAARSLLPKTKMIWGRVSAPNSHYGYRGNDPTALPNKKYTDPVRKDENATIMESRCNKLQTILPPSILPSKTPNNPDKQVVWADGCGPDPGPVTFTAFSKACDKTAAAALLGRYWPKGARHDAALALAGALAHAGWSSEESTQFIQAVCAAAEDEEVDDRIQAVENTLATVASGNPVTRWRRLAELLGEHGEVLVKKVREWLGTDQQSPTDSSILPEPPKWPDPIGTEAYYGLAGEIVQTIEPYTESDPVALLIQLLVAFGSAIGRGPHVPVEATPHMPNEYSVLVGTSGKSRKGTSYGYVQRLFTQVDPEWIDNCNQSGLSSGEGLIWAVRDPIEKRERVKERGEPVRYETVIADPGVEDKRLHVHEPEFANVLKQTERQGNILSTTIRQAWESGTLRSLTKSSPARATGAHISIVGHITADELRRYLNATEIANGFANRFMFFAIQRSKFLPDGEGMVDLSRFVPRLQAAIKSARTRGPIRRDEDANRLWRELYPFLSADRPGLAGALLGRAEAHVVRLSLLYALLDQSEWIRPAHLMAAIAVYDYAERSVFYLFGDGTGNPLADELLQLIRGSEGGITRTDISNFLGRHVTAERIGRALGMLLAAKRVIRETRDTNGRPSEVWRIQP